MFAQIQFRRDTITGWNASSSIILSEGELGLEYPNSSFLLGTSDSIRFKLGDGVHTWTQLPYYKSSVSQLKDVSFSSLNDKHILIYNSGSNEWENISTSSFNDYMSFINLKDVSGSYTGNQGKILQVDNNTLVFIDTGSFTDIADFNSFTSSINNYILNLNAYTQSSNVNFNLLNIHTGSVNAWTSSFSSSINSELYSISSSYNTTITNLSSSLDNRINNISASGATSFLDLNDTPDDYSSILTGSLSLNTLVQVSPTGGLIFVYDDKYIDYSKFGTFTSSYITDSSSFNNRITNNSSSAYSSMYELSSSAYQSLYSSSNELSSSIYSLSSSNDTRIYNLSSSISNSFMIISASIPRTLGQLWDTALGTPINNYVLTYNSSLAKWIPQAPSGGGGSGSSYFINLLDAPTSSYTGSAGKIIQVRSDETGLEFLSTQSFINSFTGSLNIPRYIGDLRDVETGSAIEDDVLKWNASLHKWIPGTPLLFSRLIELEDTPNTYSGSAGYALIINSTENGIIFAPITSSVSGSYVPYSTFNPFTSSYINDSSSFDNRILSMSINTIDLQTVLNNGSVATLISGSFILNSTGSTNKIYLETGEGSGGNSYNSYLDMGIYGNINLQSYASGAGNLSNLYISTTDNCVSLDNQKDGIESSLWLSTDYIDLSKNDIDGNSSQFDIDVNCNIGLSITDYNGDESIIHILKDGKQIELKSETGSYQYSKIAITPDNLTLEAYSGSGCSLVMNATETDHSVKFYADLYLNAGIEYGDDYSSYFTSRSLVDRGYVLNTISSSYLRPITYNELLNSIYSSSLISTQYYLITDYRTIYYMPEVEIANSGSIEPLIVQANTTGSIHTIAKSQFYPNDIIYYDVYDNIAEDDILFRPGKIFRRIDTKANIDICYDWRNVKFRRFACNHTLWSAGTYELGSIVRIANKGVYAAIESTNQNPTGSISWVKFLDLSATSYWGCKGGIIEGVSFDSNDYIDVYTFADLNDENNSSGQIYNETYGTLGFNNITFQNIKLNNTKYWGSLTNLYNSYMNNIIYWDSSDIENASSQYGNISFINGNNLNEGVECVYNNTFFYCSDVVLRGKFSNNTISNNLFNFNVLIGHNGIEYNYFLELAQIAIQSLSTISYNKIKIANNNHDLRITNSIIERVSNNIFQDSLTVCYLYTLQHNNIIDISAFQPQINNTATHLQSTYTCTIMNVSGSTTPKLSFYDSTGNIHITDVTD